MPISGSTKALMYARMGTSSNTQPNPKGPLRMGASRMAYIDPALLLKVNSTNRFQNCDLYSWEITDLLFEQPNSMTIEVFGFTPAEGQDIELYLGTTAAATRYTLFAGKIVRRTEARDRLTDRSVYRLECLDWSYLLDRRLIQAARWTAVSATTIAQEIIADYTSGFTSANVESGLGTISDFPATMAKPSEVLSRLARRVGGYWYIDQAKDLHFWTGTESGIVAVRPLNAANVKYFRGFRYDKDLTQIRTRILIEGGGSRVTAGGLTGSTRLPIEDAALFASSGTNYAKVTGGTGSQKITYTGKQAGGAGSTTEGFSAAINAPSAVLDNVAGNLKGLYTWKITATVSGQEGQPSAASAGLTVRPAAPMSAPTLAGTTGGSLQQNNTYTYKITYYKSGSPDTETEGGPSAQVALTGAQNAVNLTNIPTSPNSGITGRRIYRDSQSNPGVLELVTSIANNTATTYTDTTADVNLTQDIPTSNNIDVPAKATVTLPLGPGGTTSRQLYRPVAGGGSYKLVTTIADNTTTTYTDNIADGSLGAAIPSTSLTSTPAGSTRLPVEALDNFPDGGWVRVGSQVFSYTGRSAASGQGDLTGIPATGVGSIATRIDSGAPCLVEPQLTGIPASGTGSIARDLDIGEEVNVLVERNDAAAQTALATLEGGDGIHEQSLQDRRLNIAGCEARGDAELTLYKSVLESGQYVTNDVHVQSGKEVTVSLTSEFGVSGTFRIQRVSIRVDPDRGLWPQRTVEFSAQTRDLYDILRALQGTDVLEE